jgi:FkbM family methyltransferase
MNNLDHYAILRLAMLLKISIDDRPRPKEPTMPHLAHPLNKLRNGLYVAGWRKALTGFLNLALIKAMRPQEVEIMLKGGLALRFHYPHQMPTVLVCFGDYIDPEYNYLLPRIAPGDLVVDVGAGIGQFTLPFAKRGAIIEAFEPVPENMGMLAYNVGNNGVAGSVRFFNAAVAEHDRGISIDMAGLMSRPMEHGALFPSTTLDIQYPDQRIKVLKVDTAGGEEKVFAGAANLLEERRAQYLVVLLSNPVIEMLPLIASYGYRPFFWNPKTRQKQFLTDLTRTAILDRQIWPARQIMAEAMDL